jgi:hypothetical protein
VYTYKVIWLSSYFITTPVAEGERVGVSTL